MSWWNSNWSYRKKLTFDNSGQSENLADFPVLVKLTISNFNFSKAQSAGQDIRFVDADDTTALKYEFEKWVANTEAWIWVKVPQIDGSSSADYIWMYYGNPEASDNQDAVNTWDANYKAVYHLHKTSGSVIDSKNAHNGTNNGATRGISGKIDNAFSFDNIDDYIDCGEGAGDFETPSFTWELFLCPETIAADWRSPLLKQIISEGEGLRHHLTYYDSYRLHFGLGGTYWSVDTFSFAAGVWSHIVWSYDGSNIRVYQNGVLKSTIAYDGGVPSTSTNLRISHPTYHLYGKADEIRISSVKRSTDWIKAQYLSMTLTFITFGGEEVGIEAKTSSDSGSGVEALSSRLFGAVEIGSGIEAFLLAAALTRAEAGVGIDAYISLLQFYEKFGSDTGTGVDALRARLFAAADSGSALEAILLINALLSADSGFGAELSALMKALLATDLGIGSDRLVAKIESPSRGGDIRLPPEGRKISIPSREVYL